MMKIQSFAAIGLVFLAVGCGGGGGGNTAANNPSGVKGQGEVEVSKKAEAGFNTATDAFVAQEKTGTWAEGTCKDVAGKFEAASAEQKATSGRELPEALYNAGLTYQRCGNDAAAKEAFGKAVSADANFHRARAQLALYKFKESSDLDGAVSELDKIIQDAKFQNVEALVSLAALQMQRGSSAAGTSCPNDMACALLNLQRSLAIDDSYMPAFNQLSLYYLNQARAGAGEGKTKGGLVVSGGSKAKVDRQRLDLAALVASQATKKNPNYAPIFNTTGLIMVELENYNGAVKAFGRARQLNPKFFEAQMNYAALNLGFRGYGEAEAAYREALKQRPNTYEAHLGLALALRGGINDSNFEANLAEAQKHLDEAKKLEPSRPEAYYNEAILCQEYRAKRAADESATIAEFRKASEEYDAFVSKAQGKSEFADAVKRAKDRVQDIKDTLQFMEESKRMAEEDARQQAEMKKQEEEAQKAQGAAPADGAAPAPQQ